MYGFWMLVIAAAMTSFYSWRLMFLTFYGKPRGDKHTTITRKPDGHADPAGRSGAGGDFCRYALVQLLLWSRRQGGQILRHPGGQASTEGHAAEGEAAAHGTDASEGHGEETAAAGEHHYVFAGKPGEGALYMAPDNHVLDDAHAAPMGEGLAPSSPCSWALVWRSSSTS